MAGFEPANLGSSGKYDNHGTTGVDYIGGSEYNAHGQIHAAIDETLMSHCAQTMNFQTWVPS